MQAETQPSPPLAAATQRRGFLAGLASLPLVGGSVALLGRPSAVAEPITEALIWGYKDWLYYEHRMLSYELAGYDPEQAKLVERLSRYSKAGPAGDWHFNFPTRKGSRLAGWPEAPQPSTRAALVLSAAGVDWRESDERAARRRA